MLRPLRQLTSFFTRTNTLARAPVHDASLMLPHHDLCMVDQLTNPRQLARDAVEDLDHPPLILHLLEPSRQVHCWWLVARPLHSSAAARGAASASPPPVATCGAVRWSCAGAWPRRQAPAWPTGCSLSCGDMAVAHHTEASCPRPRRRPADLTGKWLKCQWPWWHLHVRKH